jgi:hypothetical protein
VKLTSKTRAFPDKCSPENVSFGFLFRLLLPATRNHTILLRTILLRIDLPVRTGLVNIRFTFAYHGMMQVLVHALSNNGWTVHCIAEDCKTPLSPFVDVESLDTLQRLLRCAGASAKEMESFEGDIKVWSHSSVWIDELTPDGARLLRIRVSTVKK